MVPISVLLKNSKNVEKSLHDQRKSDFNRPIQWKLLFIKSTKKIKNLELTFFSLFSSSSRLNELEEALCKFVDDLPFEKRQLFMSLSDCKAIDDEEKTELGIWRTNNFALGIFLIRIL